MGENKRAEKKRISEKQGNTVLTNDKGIANSETEQNIETVREYIRQHFARKQEEWEVECVQNEIWASTENQEELPQECHKHTKRHNESILQQYARTSQQRRHQINQLGGEITQKETSQAIKKLSSRKSVGKDQITAEIIKANQEWITPILRKLLNSCNKRNAMPKSWLR